MSLTYNSFDDPDDVDLEDGDEITLEFTLPGKIEAASDAETIMGAERTRYAQVIADLDELEEVLAAQEAEASFAFMHTDDESAEAEEDYPFL